MTNTILEVGKQYKTVDGQTIVVVQTFIDIKDFKLLFEDNSQGYTGYESVLAFNLDKKSFMAYMRGGSYQRNRGSSFDLLVGKSIIINGKEIELSVESYEELKRSLLDD